MKRNDAAVFVVLLILAIAGFAGAEDGVEKAAEQKTFRVDNATVDLGVVRAGSDGVAVFVFTNDTDKDVKIIRAKPT